MFPISVILPVYNGKKYLKKCVDSVINQSFTDFELLILDDCSTDSSWEYLVSLNDNRIKLFRNETNKGLFFNLNYLIKKSNSKLVKLWSQDDIMYNNCLAEIINFHKENATVGFSYTGSDHIDATGTRLLIDKSDKTPSIISSALHARIAFITGSIAGNISNVTITKMAFDKVGLFNEQMKISGDFEMWVRIAKDFDIGYIKLPLIQLRSHKEQLSSQEEYFIFHLKEDMQVYKLLFSYLSDQQRKMGKSLLRSQKLLFYYTLMLKAAFKGNVRLSLDFFKTISHFDNIIILSWFYVKYKVFKFRPKFN